MVTGVNSEKWTVDKMIAYLEEVKERYGNIEILKKMIVEDNLYGHKQVYGIRELSPIAGTISQVTKKKHSIYEKKNGDPIYYNQKLDHESFDIISTQNAYVIL